MIRISAIFLLAVMFLSGCNHMTENDSNEPTSEQYQEGVYIPKDLNDCFAELKRILSPEEIEKMKKGTEDDVIDYHMGLGSGLRNDWGLWKGSRLSRWFNEKGIYHPDDMSGIILDSFWRDLNSKPIKLDEQIKYYQDYWNEIKESEKKSSTDLDKPSQ